MNYDVYEVEMDTGIPGYRLLQHVKAIDAQDAQATVAPQHDFPVKSVTFRRPCTEKEIAEAIGKGIVADGTKPTAVDAEGAVAAEVRP